MRTRARRFARRGVAATEAALVLPVFLALVLGMIDLAVAISRSNTLSHAARQAAPHSMVHGSLTTTGSNGGLWDRTIDQPRRRFEIDASARCW